MRERGLPIKGIIFNGEDKSASEKYILDYTRLSCIGKIETECEINPKVIEKYRERWKKNFPI